MTPTEKHMERAESLCWWCKHCNCDPTTTDVCHSVASIARALANAEREGMEAERARCADLLAAVTGVFRRCEIENDWTALIETLSTALLSEAGEG